MDRKTVVNVISLMILLSRFPQDFQMTPVVIHPDSHRIPTGGFRAFSRSFQEVFNSFPRAFSQFVHWLSLRISTG